jgi:hypothetical protein
MDAGRDSEFLVWAVDMPETKPDAVDPCLEFMRLPTRGFWIVEEAKELLDLVLTVC